MRLSLRDAPVLVSAVACVAAGCEREVQPVVVAPEEVPTAAPEAEPVVRRVTATTTCPDALEAPDLTDRIIKASCGVVRVKKGYRVDAGTLTLEAGVTLAFEPEAELTVGYRQPAKLIVAGTREQPVLFTSTETKAAGAWKGLYLYEHADGSRIQGLHIEYAAQGIRGPIYVLADDVTIDDSEIRDSLDVAVHVSQKGRLTSFTGNKIERMSAKVAMFLPPSSVAAVGPDNQFPADSVIHVLAGIVRERVRWSNPGVPYVIGGVLEIAGEDDESEALLELSPGTVLRFDSDAYMNVGYYRPGVLRAEGMPDQPIVFTSAVEQVAGAWRGISLYKNASASFSHATFEFGSRRSDRGVLFANSEAALSLQDCLFRDNGGGVVLQGADLRVTAARERNRWERSTPAIDASAQAFGFVGEGNVFGPEHAQIIVEGGSIERVARWRDLGVPLDVTQRGPRRQRGEADDRPGGRDAGPRRVHAGGRRARRRVAADGGAGGAADLAGRGQRPPGDVGRDPPAREVDRERAAARAAAQRGRGRGGRGAGGLGRGDRAPRSARAATARRCCGAAARR
jgi:hypothetical protein